MNNFELKIFAFIVIILSVYTSSKGWKLLDYYATNYGDLKTQPVTRKQSEYFRYSSFFFLLCLTALITFTVRPFLEKNTPTIVTSLGVTLAASFFIGALKIMGKIEFKPLFTTQKFLAQQIFTIFFIFLSGCMLTLTFLLAIKNGLTVEDFLKTFK